MTHPLEQASDLELARLSQESDESAFAEIVRRHSPRVFQIASRFFRERSQVEDASQEVFLRAYTHLADYEGRGSLEGWLTRIATTTCLNLLRASQRRPESALAEMPEAEAGSSITISPDAPLSVTGRPRRAVRQPTWPIESWAHCHPTIVWF